MKNDYEKVLINYLEEKGLKKSDYKLRQINTIKGIDKLKNCKDYYYINSLGFVYSLYRKKVKLLSFNADETKNEYFRVDLASKNDIRVKPYVHILVDLAFNTYSDLETKGDRHHLNWSKYDNRASNISYLKAEEHRELHNNERWNKRIESSEAIQVGSGHIRGKSESIYNKSQAEIKGYDWYEIEKALINGTVYKNRLWDYELVPTKETESELVKDVEKIIDKLERQSFEDSLFEEEEENVVLYIVSELKVMKRDRKGNEIKDEEE